MNELMRQWHVICSISGERILIADLLYWHVEKQQVYARPELVPHEHFGY